jgi:DnaA-homolog protein
MSQQLAFDFGYPKDKVFNTFVSGENQELINALTTTASEQNYQSVFFFGEQGTGKSHLLYASCAAIGAEVAYLPLTETEYFSTEVCQGLENLKLVCIDDIDQIAGNILWEEALFHLYNQMKDANNRLFISSQKPLNEIPFKLLDLQSRLAWGLTYEITSLSDDEKITALQQHASIRSMQIASAPAKYLLNHFSRNMTTLVKLLENLDKASLSAQRKLTIPFIKQALGESLS